MPTKLMYEVYKHAKRKELVFTVDFKNQIFDEVVNDLLFAELCQEVSDPGTSIDKSIIQQDD